MCLLILSLNINIGVPGQDKEGSRKAVNLEGFPKFEKSG